MSKKVILSTLLTSAALLGVASTTHAATSDIKAESKKITITADNAKLYKDSSMKESTKAKKGAVYQVDGYRNINGKHVYRLYQKDQYNKDKYKGYLVDKDAKELKSAKASGQFVAKKEATMWENFYWNNKREVTNQEKVFFAKYSYTLGNGDKYYSMHYKNKFGEDTWAGYTNASNVKALKATEQSTKFTLTKNYKTWNNLYFKQNKNSYDYTKGVNFQAKRYYTLNGDKFYSVYRTDKDGKSQWCGYANGYVLKELKAVKSEQTVQVLKDYNTYKDHFFNKKAKLEKGKKVMMTLTYTYGNGKKYVSLYDVAADGKRGEWLGYANIDAVAKALSDEETKQFQDTLDKAKKLIDDAKGAATPEAEKAAEEAYNALETQLKNNATEPNKNNLINLEKDLEAKVNALAPSILSQWTYEEKDGKIVLSHYKGKQTNVVVPGKIDNKPVAIDTKVKNFDAVYAPINLVFATKDPDGQPSQTQAIKEITFREIDGQKVTTSENTAAMFYYALALEKVDLSGLDLSQAADLSSFFTACESLKEVDLSSQNLSKVKTTEAMFSDCLALETVKFGDSMKDDVINANMHGMFDKCENLTSLDLTNVSTKSVTNMNYMFGGCAKLTDLKVAKDFGQKVNEGSDQKTKIEKAEDLIGKKGNIAIIDAIKRDTDWKGTTSGSGETEGSQDSSNENGSSSSNESNSGSNQESTTTDSTTTTPSK